MKEKMKRIVVSILALLFMLPMYASAVTWDVDDGQLMGASEVDVNGVFYDVRFVDGTCEGLFSGCDDLFDFAFNTNIDVVTAARALLDQVFLDVPEGNFDSMPQSINGISSTEAAHVYTPYDFFTSGGGTLVLIRETVNTRAGWITPDRVQIFDNIAIDFDTALYEYPVWAVWTPSVPEPSTIFLLGSGLFVLVAFRKKLRR